MRNDAECKVRKSFIRTKSIGRSVHEMEGKALFYWSEFISVNTSLKYCIYESIQLKEYDIWEFILSRAGNSNMAKTYSVL